MTTRRFDTQADEDAEQARVLAEWLAAHPDALRRDWRQTVTTLAVLVLLGAGAALFLGGIVIGMDQAGPWAAVSVIGAVTLLGLVVRGER